MSQGLPHTEVDLLRAFEDHLALERRLSVHTVAAYRGDLEQLATFLTRDRSSLGSAPYPLLRRFLAQQHTLGYARATIARRVGSASAANVPSRCLLRGAFTAIRLPARGIISGERIPAVI